MIDNFKINGNDNHEALQSPVTGFHSFTNSDTINEPLLVRGFQANTNGNVVCMLENDTEPTTIVVLAGLYYPYRIKRVYTAESGTTATIVGIL